MTTGSSDTHCLQPCCALFLATQLDEATNHKVESVPIVCFGPPSRDAPAPDGRRLTQSTVGPCPWTAGNGGLRDDETRRAASPIRQPWRRASRITHHGKGSQSGLALQEEKVWLRQESWKGRR